MIEKLSTKRAVVGHSFGGLFTQILAGRRLSAVSVAIEPAQFRGILQLPLSTLRSGFPVLGNPLNRGRAKALTLDQFNYGWANALDDEEAKQLHETYHVPGPGMPLFQAASANLNPGTEAKVDSENPERGPLLLISGEADHTIPPVLVGAAYKKQQRNEGVTEIEKVPNRGHSLTIDKGLARGRRQGRRLRQALRVRRGLSRPAAIRLRLLRRFAWPATQSSFERSCLDPRLMSPNGRSSSLDVWPTGRRSPPWQPRAARSYWRRRPTHRCAPPTARLVSQNWGSKSSAPARETQSWEPPGTGR